MVMPRASCGLCHHTATLDNLKHVILAVDTSLGTSVAIVRDGEVRASHTEPNPLGHAEVIGELLQRALADAAATPREIETVVTGMGPGPFTGLRVGIATARAFAIGAHAAVFPVPSHLALAAASQAAGHNGEFAVVTDARRREVAITIFDGLDADGLPRFARETFLAPRSELDSVLGATQFAEASVLDAAHLALVAEVALRAGRTLTSGEPLYLRAPDVAAPKAARAVQA